jgi:hypothetical protein
MFYINIPNIMYDGVNETGFQSFVSNWLVCCVQL